MPTKPILIASQFKTRRNVRWNTAPKGKAIGLPLSTYQGLKDLMSISSGPFSAKWTMGGPGPEVGVSVTCYQGTVMDVESYLAIIPAIRARKARVKSIRRKATVATRRAA